MKLHAFGCSLTYGNHLPDNSYYQNGSWKINDWPSEMTWANVVAKHFNRTIVNHSKSGASNKEIWYTLMNANIQKGDIVCVMWTETNRTCRLTQQGIEQIGLWLARNKHSPSSSYYTHIWDEVDAKTETCKHIQLASDYLHSGNIEHYHLVQRPNDLVDDAWFSADVLPVFLTQWTHDGDLARDKLHPGATTHKAFGEAVVQHILNGDTHAKL